MLFREQYAYLVRLLICEYKSFFSSSLNRRLLFLLMYMLQRAKVTNDVAKAIVAILFVNRDSAVPSITIRLTNCSISSILAFMVSFFESPIYQSVSISLFHY